MSQFTIIVDSNCDLPTEYIEKHGIEVLPMPFELDGMPHDRGYWQEISDKDFYSALRKGGIAKTSQINPDTFIESFTGYTQQGREALFLILSSGLSNTFASAQLALEEFRAERPDCGIYILDTISATVGHGLLAMMAVEKRAEGFSASETADWLEGIKRSCIGLFTVNDLMYLHRGGRLSKLSAIAGSALGLKPMLCIGPDGTLSIKDKARSKKAAIEMMVSQLRQCINPGTDMDTVMISHTDCPEDAELLADTVRAYVNVREVISIMMGPVIGAHLGPGSLVLLFKADITREEYDEKFQK